MPEVITVFAPLWQPDSPYLYVFLLVTVGIWVVPFAEELALASAGYFIYRGEAQWSTMLMVVGGGILLGDAVLFCLGRVCRLPRISRWRMVRRYASRITTVNRLLDRYGALALFGSRFVPGSRLFAHLLVGAGGMTVTKYLVTNLLALGLYVPFMVRTAYLFGSEIEETVASLQALEAVSWMVIVGGIGLWALLSAKSRATRTGVTAPLSIPIKQRGLSAKPPQAQS